MPNWKQLLDEANSLGSTYDILRRRCLDRMYRHTKRNIIIYYSGWLQKPGLLKPGFAGFSINDSDKNGFMASIHRMDKKKGLDLVLHTPGGDLAATESLVDYLRSWFGNDIRALIPQMAMSAGTMMALASREIVMGKHSSLGPIDPQIGSISAHGVIEEFNRAAKEIKNDPSRIPLWQPIIAKYHPTLIGECQKAIDWSKGIVKQWLMSGMFVYDDDKAAKAERIVDELADHEITKSHSRHISLRKAKDELGLNVRPLEDDDNLQEALLSTHHACILTMQSTPAIKIIENHKGVAYIQQIALPSAKN